MMITNVNGKFTNFDVKATAENENFENPEIEANNAILDELETFADAINNDTTPVVTLEDGNEALRVAYMIIDSMNEK